MQFKKIHISFSNILKLLSDKNITTEAKCKIYKLIVKCH